MLGVILDAEKQYAEAEKCYDLAVKLEPLSTVLLNNLGNHYLVQGKSESASGVYLRVIGLDSHHENANLHLAEMSVGARDGNSALHYLQQLLREAQSQPPAEFLRAKALHLVGNSAAAENLLDQVEKQSTADPRIPFSAGMIFVEWGLFARAEQALSQARELAPANFDVLYNLGLAAARAGHLERAQTAFEAALHEKSDDVDCLYNLSRVCVERGHPDQAVGLLAEAERLAPERAEIALALAHVSEKLGSYSDAAQAYEKYLKLRPHDDSAQRERGFALARNAKYEEASADLQWYVRKHPRDSVGFYELGVVETAHDRHKAVEHLNQAVLLDPHSVAARYARAVLNYQQGKPAAAENDLQFILKRDPNNYRALDALGEVDLTLNRPAQAEEYLRKAANLAPTESKVLIHFARALQEVGREEAAQKVLSSLKQLGVSATRPGARNGDFQRMLSMPTAQPETVDVSSLRSKLEKNPNDLNLNLELGKALLNQGKTAEALNAYRKVRDLTSDPRIDARCGKDLLDSEQYGLAQQFLRDAAARDPSSADTRLDLVVALFHSAGPAAALAELDVMLPVSGKYEGDYYLLRAQVLDGMGPKRQWTT